MISGIVWMVCSVFGGCFSEVLLRYERLPFASQLGWLGLLRHDARHITGICVSHVGQYARESTTELHGLEWHMRECSVVDREPGVVAEESRLSIVTSCGLASPSGAARQYFALYCKENGITAIPHQIDWNIESCRLTCARLPSVCCSVAVLPLNLTLHLSRNKI